MDLTKQEIEKIGKTVKEILNNKEVQLFVFGSRAKGTARANSDLDIAIKSKEPLSLGELGRLKETFEESDFPYRVDIVDYEDVSATIRARIDKSALKIG